MTTEEFNKLSPGDKVTHKRYGQMTVTEFIPDFGPLLIADEKTGCELLASDSGAPFGTPFLEDQPRQIKPLVQRAN